MPSFADLGLKPELLQTVAEQGYVEPTPIQVRAIPLVLEGRDVMGGAQTGTGKTAGFTLPLLQRLAHYANTSASPARHPVRALILAPTRELAAQVEESVRVYGKHVGLRCTVVFGGVPIEPQIEMLRRGVEILVATPGRLLDHVQQRAVHLSQVEVFVLDEADRMLDMGFIPDVRRIISLLPKRRQNLLFSATISNDIRELADFFLNQPVMVQVASPTTAAESVRHLVHPARREKKRELLAHVIRSRGLQQVLVFTSTRLGANRLAYQLNRDGLHVTAIHGDKSQPERMKALSDFKSGKVRVLVATDVAARGLDIVELPHVVNFELPPSPEDYLHRIGRTGRAGSTGEAISLVCAEEHERLAAIEKTLQLTIERQLVPGFEPDPMTVTSLIGRARSRGGRTEHAPRKGPPAPALEQRGDRGRGPGREERPDPLMHSPYEPASGDDSAPSNAPAKRPARQVAALLGGLRLKSR